MRISGRSALGPTFIRLLISGIVAAALATAPRAFGQNATSDRPTVPGPAHASDAPSQKASAALNAPVNTGAITQGLNQELGLDLNAKVADWGQHLDRLESDLRRPNLRYSELTAYRDELQRIRGEAKDLAKRLPAPLDAAKAQLNLLGPAPGAGQPPAPADDRRQRERDEQHFHVFTNGGLRIRAQPLVGRLFERGHLFFQ